MLFFLIGMAKSMVFNKPIIQARFATLLTGGAAASLAFVTGYMLREVFASIDYKKRQMLTSAN